MNKKKNYYFTMGVSFDSDTIDFDEPCFGDEDDQYIYDLINSADYIYFCSFSNGLTANKLQSMINSAIKNIIGLNSKIFDYSEFDEEYELDKYDVSEEDIMLELQELYDIETGRSYAPLIWGDDVWEDDDSYTLDSPPKLWRMYLCSDED